MHSVGSFKSLAGQGFSDNDIRSNPYSTSVEEDFLNTMTT